MIARSLLIAVAYLALSLPAQAQAAKDDPPLVLLCRLNVEGYGQLGGVYHIDFKAGTVERIRADKMTDTTIEWMDISGDVVFYRQINRYTGEFTVMMIDPPRNKSGEATGKCIPNPEKKF